MSAPRNSNPKAKPNLTKNNNSSPKKNSVQPSSPPNAKANSASPTPPTSDQKGQQKNSQLNAPAPTTTPVKQNMGQAGSVQPTQKGQGNLISEPIQNQDQPQTEQVSPRPRRKSVAKSPKNSAPKEPEEGMPTLSPEVPVQNEPPVVRKHRRSSKGQSQDPEVDGVQSPKSPKGPRSPRTSVGGPKSPGEAQINSVPETPEAPKVEEIEETKLLHKKEYHTHGDSESEDSLSEIGFMHWTPPNLEVLTDVKIVTVRQQEDEQDSITDMDLDGLDSHNYYNVFDETSAPKMIFQAVEKTDRHLKKKGQKRLYLIEIHDLQGGRVLTLERSQASFMGDGIEITLADGTFLGGIRSGCSCVCCSSYLDVFDSSRTTLLYIEDRGWCSREFAVVKRNDKTKIVAYLSKRFLDSVQESKSDADVYLLELRGNPDTMSPAVKTLLMCAVFFIDFKYFEDVRTKETEAKKKTSRKSVSQRKRINKVDGDMSSDQHPKLKLRNINAILNKEIDMDQAGKKPGAAPFKRKPMDESLSPNIT